MQEALLPMKCCKCGDQMTDGGCLTPSYNEVIVKFDTGTMCHVGICRCCELEDSDLPKLVKTLKKSKIPCCEIVEVVKRLSVVDVLKETQQGCCARTGKPLNANYVFTNGRLENEAQNETSF